MNYFSKSFENLIEELEKLPGVGKKSATRLAFHILDSGENAINFSNAIVSAVKNTKHCKCCNTISDEDICPICKDMNRDHSTIMVVENERDMYAYEKIGKYNGVYHVLMGALSPMLGIGPEQIKIKELMNRLTSNVKEVILATNQSIEGETTSAYLTKLIKPYNIKLTRLATGMPVGGDIENIDEVTLQRAFLGRVCI